MENQAGIRAPHYRLPESTKIGRVRLAVSDLARSTDFYQSVIGLAPVDGPHRLGVAGTQTVLLELEAPPGVKSIGRRTRLGLYHPAFLLPSEQALSAFVDHLRARNVPFGSSDHLYSQALYLTDPDGLTVEVYADRPRSQWIYEAAELVAAVDPLRFAELPQMPEESWQGAPAGTTIGHVHFYIGDLPAAKRFYHEALGLDIMTWRYPGALFTSAGGYHHHVGLNIWAAGSPPASKEDARLLFWELQLPNQQEVDHLKVSMTQAGYQPHSLEGRSSFTDAWGITVVPAVAQAGSMPDRLRIDRD